MNLQEDQKVITRSKRLVPVDLLRGFLIVVMALDHANYYIAQQHSSGEYWGGPVPVYASPVHFLTRFITHLSAPGFFFLMGMGMVLFTRSRMKMGWSLGRIRVHFLFRGLVLALLQLLIVYFGAWSLSPTPAPLWYVGVLAALGAGMILGIPFLDLKPVYQLAAAGLFFVILEILTPNPALWGSAFSNLPGVFLVYGGGSENFWVNYPLLAWVEVILFGMAYGSWLDQDREKTYQSSFLVGGLFLAGFLILRVLNGFGNIRPYQPGEWREFFSLVKYPPSMSFILLAMGVNLILLGISSIIRSAWHKSWNPLLVFGRVPLFAYLGHIVIYLLIGKFITPSGSSLGVMYLFWLIGLAGLYPLARWYWQYKNSRSENSWVRKF